MEIEKIEKDIKQILSERRYNHSVGVMKKAEELARRYNQDVEKAKLVGIAHDIAKEMGKNTAFEYAKNHNIKLDEIEINEPALLHSKIGACMCMLKYSFTKDMTQAIKYHTTGHPDMNIFDKIIFIADKIEDGRTNQDLDKIREIANEDLDEAMLYLLRKSIKYTIDKNDLVHTDSINLMNKLIIEKYK